MKAYAIKEKEGQLALDAANGMTQLEKDCSAVFCISAEDCGPDADGDIVRVAGIDVQRWAQHGAPWFLHHQEGNSGLPIGTSLKDGRLHYWTEGPRAYARCFFDKKDPTATFLWQKCRDGLMKSCSIAFIPVQATPMPEKAYLNRGNAQMARGHFFEQCHLTEISLVGVSCNPSAYLQGASKSFVQEHHRYVKKGLGLFSPKQPKRQLVAPKVSDVQLEEEAKALAEQVVVRRELKDLTKLAQQYGMLDEDSIKALERAFATSGPETSQPSGERLLVDQGDVPVEEELDDDPWSGIIHKLQNGEALGDDDWQALEEHQRSCGCKDLTGTEGAPGGYVTPPVSPSLGKEEQPSDNFTPDKARRVLAEGVLNGQPLTEAQRRMLQAAAHSSKQQKDMNQADMEPAGGLPANSSIMLPGSDRQEIEARYDERATSLQDIMRQARREQQGRGASDEQLEEALARYRYPSAGFYGPNTDRMASERADATHGNSAGPQQRNDRTETLAQRGRGSSFADRGR